MRSLTSLNKYSTLSRDRIFLQKYEDLITNPKMVLKSLCGFLGIPFEDRMLEFYNKQESKDSAKTSIAWENLKKPLMQSNSGKFKKDL